ncbi:winged helix-turn-helix transcriptional regulator [Halobacteria archaeon AArc-m2/3/4]|uniref:Winged helix-turn-helix transcriptional regulator n=1 Tax=Natronoglomus mannanivorans TaxID=2979990 RepID=A0ABT2QE75_9EURY|nr:winged helix-turn-helix transcriptional regulator [Halobacteria archaeon AArc-m2/3/4]
MTDREVDVPPSKRVALDALSLLSNKWHPVVVVVLCQRGPLGFNALLEAIPDVSGKVLSAALEALQNAGLVERTVVSESPLRVEYDLTEAGSEMDAVFEALSTWGQRHLETATPTILLADADRRITAMYGEWLADRYTTVRAHNGEELEARLDGDVDVVVYDEGLPGVDSGELLGAVRDDCRTVALVGDRPGFDLLSLTFDDVRRKPIVRETALDAIDAQLRRRGESPERRERASLAARRSLLESVYSREHLEGVEAYAELRRRMKTLDDRLEA